MTKYSWNTFCQDCAKQMNQQFFFFQNKFTVNDASNPNPGLLYEHALHFPLLCTK